jgi:hypothetical protein
VKDVPLASSAALAYTLINGLGWPRGKRERLADAVPMTISLLGPAISLATLLE